MRSAIIFLFRYRMLRPIFHWVWFRMKKGRPVEGVGMDEARAIKASGQDAGDLNTGGYQTASYHPRRDQLRRVRRRFDRPLADRQQRSVKQWADGPRSARAAVHLLQQMPAQRRQESRWAATSRSRFANHDAMVEELMTIYATRPT